MFVSINKLKSYRPVLPLGMVAVATQVRRAGHQGSCVDLMFEEDDEAVVTREVTRFVPDLVGISVRNVDSLNLLEPAVYTPIAREVAEWAWRARPGVEILLGGAGFSVAAEDLMDFVGADYGLAGYAEESAVELLARLEAGSGVRDVPGLVQPRPGGGYHRTPPATTIAYHRLAPPDRELYDPRYFQYTYETHDVLASVPVSVQTKKGCLLNCSYCSNFLVDGHGVKPRPAADVADEIERIAEDGFTGYEIVDGVFNVPLAHALAILRELANRRITLPWSCMVNPGTVTSELVDLLVRTGCRQVELGTNSGHDRVLRELQCGFRSRQALRANRLFQATGIAVMHCLFIGAPGDDAGSVRRTLDVAGELAPPGSPAAHAYWTYGLRISPGTGLAARAVREGLIRGDERFLVPKYYVSPAVAGDDALLDEIQERVLANPNWYLWWGLSGIPLRERIRLATTEHREIEQMLLRHLDQRALAATGQGSMPC